jgi:hypothetical protein
MGSLIFGIALLGIVAWIFVARRDLRAATRSGAA